MNNPVTTFTSYEKFVIAILALMQFTVILDFMVLSPLGAILMPRLGISTSQFGLVVSAYAFSAGISGLSAAGFADRFDRKKMLIIFYIGFLCGTLFCALANSYQTLLLARVITGIFGGVIGSISSAIITDMFPMHARGRVMGVVQMAFAASQVLGIPVGLFLATQFDWHAPFLLIAALALIIVLATASKFKPVIEHLQGNHNESAFVHFWSTASKPFYIRGFAATILLATGGFMIMPFSTAFLVNNVLIPEARLPEIFFITGFVSIFTGPFLGKQADIYGKYSLFVFGSILSLIMVIMYTHLGPTPIWVVIVINIILYTGISSRMISSAALISGVPDVKDRGAYMGINSSIQHMSGGVASYVAGLIVHQPAPNAPLQHFDTIGYVTACTMLITLCMLYFIDRDISKKLDITHV